MLANNDDFWHTKRIFWLQNYTIKGANYANGRKKKVFIH